MTYRRLIEETFPLKKVSEDSKHENNVRHGHISTLHIWPARRPLAACRAAIIAALLPDPGDEQSRHELNKKIEALPAGEQRTARAGLSSAKKSAKLTMGAPRACWICLPAAGQFLSKRCAWAVT